VPPEGFLPRIGSWLSAALDDPNVCAEMKADILAWFDAGMPSRDLPAALAEARVEVAALQRDLADARGAVHRLMHEGSVQIAAMEAANAAMRAALVRVIEMQSEHLYGHSETAAVARAVLARLSPHTDTARPRND
jgi:hypothetical protein